MRRLLWASLAVLLLGLARASGEEDKNEKQIIFVVPGENFTMPDPDPDEGGGADKHPIDGIVRGHFIPVFGSGHAVRGGTPGEFNLYIFAMSWKAEWCHHAHYPGCNLPREFWKTNLTIHGLWPDYGDGSYPTACTQEEFDHDLVVNTVGLELLETMWPNVEVREEEEKYDSFWHHEWTKHGTCTGLSQVDYFTTTVSVLEDRFPTPSIISSNVGATVTREELEDAYGGDGKAVFQCHKRSGLKYLNQVMLCFDKDDDTGAPGEQVTCPSAVKLHDDSCGSTGEIFLSSF